jgi:adenylate cyclase
MPELTASELAERSGTTAETIAHYVELGIIRRDEDDKPFGSGDIQRVRLVRALEESGISVEDVGRAITDGHISLDFVDTLFADPVSLSTTTYRGLAESSGMTLEELDRLGSALGLPLTSHDDPVPDDDLAIARLWTAASSVMDPEAVARISRVYGESLQRIADAERNFVDVHVFDPMLRAGMPPRQAIDSAAQIGRGLQSIADELVLLLHRRLMHRHTIQNFVWRLERALAEAGIVPERLEDPPAIAFLDLSGFTSLTEEQGDEKAARLAQGLAELCQESARSRGGRLVKLLGDGAMLHFPRPESGVLCALDLVDRVPRLGLPAARVGMHAGRVVSQDGDYFGATVNVAARIAYRAGPGQVLVTDEVVASADSGSVRYERVGTLALKNVAEPVTVHLASRAE